MNVERDTVWLCPKGWTFANLEDIVEEVEKVNPKLNPDDEFTYVEIASIDNARQRVASPKKCLGRDAPSRARQLVKGGDTLFSTVRTYLKNIALVHEEYDGQIASTGFCVIRPHRFISNKYVFLLVQSHGFLNRLTDIQRGTSYPAVRDSDVVSQRVPVAPAPEQHRIVAKIEELFTRLDAGVEALGAVQVQLKRYRQAVLKHAFEGKLTEKWRKAHKHELEPASVLLERIRQERKKKAKEEGKKYKEPPPVDTTDLPELPEGWEWANSCSLFVWSNGKGLTKKAMKEGEHKVYGGNGVSGYHNHWLCENSSIVVGRVGAHCGNVHLAEPRSWITDNAIYSSWIADEIHLPFSAMFLLTVRLNRLSGGSGQPYVSQAILNPLAIAVPSVPEQRQIVREVERSVSLADKLEEVIRQCLSQSRRLRQSVLKLAFEGRLVPQDPTDEPADKLLERIRAEKAKMQATKPKKARTIRKKGSKEVQETFEI